MPYNSALPPPPVVPVSGPGNDDVNYSFGDYTTDQLLWPESQIDHMDLLPFQPQPYMTRKLGQEPYWYAGGQNVVTSQHQQHHHHHHPPQQQSQLHAHPIPIPSLHPGAALPTSVSAVRTTVSGSAPLPVVAVGPFGTAASSISIPSPYNTHPMTHPRLTSSESFSTTTSGTTTSSGSPPPLSHSPDSSPADASTYKPALGSALPKTRKPAGLVSGSSIICKWPTCKKVFTRWRDLNHHWLSHEKPFSCPTCGHRAATKTHLRRHTNTHRREEKYYCQYPGCYRSRDGPGKPFYRKDNCRNHMKDVHGLFEGSSCS